MKWKYPKIGDKRIVKRFAFVPVKLDNGYKVWLEYFWSKECYTQMQDGSNYWRRLQATQKEK